jgi:hypothetical protein
MFRSPHLPKAGTPMNAGPRPTAHEVAVAAHKLVAAYGWQSVDPDLLVAQVREQLAAGAVLAEPYGLERLCERAAAEQLYAGCGLPPPTPAAARRREQAYPDVGQSLLAVGPRQLPPPPPDMDWPAVVQDTLQEIYLTLLRRQDTRGFLALALVILRRQSAGRWKARKSQSAHEQSLDLTADDPSGAGPAISDVSIEGTRDPYRSVDPQGDREVLLILGRCLQTVEQRTIGLGLYLGLKRREILLVFQDLAGNYDNLRRAVEQRLARCSRVRRLRDPAAPSVPCPVRGCPDPAGGAF